MILRYRKGVLRSGLHRKSASGSSSLSGAGHLRDRPRKVVGTDEIKIFAAVTRDVVIGQTMNDLGVGEAGAPNPVRIYFFGYFKYKSLFGQKEIVGFCWLYRLGMKRFVREDKGNYTYRRRDW